MKYYIAGNRGLVGKHYTLHTNAVGGNTNSTDYTDYKKTLDDLTNANPTHVVLNAATVGGLQEDLDRSFDLMLRNLKIQNNIFEAADKLGIQRLLLQGSACSYPHKGSDIQTFTEDQLMDGEPYAGYLTTALPKLVGMYQCRASNERKNTKWRTAINTNLFGPGDRTGDHAHVIGALMQKFVNAVKHNHTEIEIWGSGNQSRDLLYIKDAVVAMDIILNNDLYDTVNVCSGTETTIREIAETLKTISGFTGRLWYNTDRPEGSKHRSISNTRLQNLGWTQDYAMIDALQETYEWYYDNT
jgi:GDP-L-fucose synthase|tara:strand:+ start:5320 stop:6216 length:897 start_codon:yes stop_codon:yes gene_type:complete